MTNIENSLMPNILEACDAILANPDKPDYIITKYGKDGLPSERYCKFIKGFSIIAYGYKKA